MVTTSSSDTRGSTTNISSYVRMGGYCPPYGLGLVPLHAEQRGGSIGGTPRVRPVTRVEILQDSPGKARDSYPLKRPIAASIPSASQASQASAARRIISSTASRSSGAKGE